MEDLKIFESLPQVMLLVKADTPRFTVLAASAGYREAVGKSKEDFVGMPYFECLSGSRDLIPPSFTTSMRSSFEYVLSHNSPNTIDTTPLAGLLKGYSSVFNQPVTNPAGELAYIIQTFTPANVNGFDREAELRREIEKTAELFHQAPVATALSTWLAMR
jgi:hypothetical protein